MPTRIPIITPTYSTPNRGSKTYKTSLEFEHGQKTCLNIECQIDSTQKELRTHPSKQQKINMEHEKRITRRVQPVQDKKRKYSDAQRRKAPKTTDEAEVEEMRQIYMQYDRGSIGVPDAGMVDAFFDIIANTEHRLMKAEELPKAAKRREVVLKGKLHKARRAVLDMDRGIGGVGKGIVRTEVEELEVKEESRNEDYDGSCFW